MNPAKFLGFVMRPGAMYGDSLSNHTELSAVSDAVVAAIAKAEADIVATA